MSYDFEGELLRQKINSNSEESKKKAEEAYRKSQEKGEQKLKKKKQKKDKIKRAIAAIALATTVAIGAAAITTSVINENNVVISLENADKEIDDKISHYESLMNMYSGETAIEIYAGRASLTKNSEPNVYYNSAKLADHLIEAAKISEEELRCATLAAFKIINEPYRNETINFALASASSRQEENSNYTIPATTDEFLESLGYENWQEYNNNERRNIKEQKAIRKHIGGNYK